jgi:hypothetical protein
MLVFLRIAWVNVAAVAGSIAAIAPMFGRRRPFGTRTGPVAARGARVIPFEPGRRAQNR